MKKELRYLYFFIEKPVKATKPFRLARLKIELLSQNIQLYQAWRPTLLPILHKEKDPQFFPVPPSVLISRKWRDWSDCSPSVITNFS